MTEAFDVKEQKMQQEREEQILVSTKIMQTADWLRTIVFRVRKQWDYCCLVPICMLKTMVCSSLLFDLTKEQMVCFVLLGFTKSGDSTV